MILRTLEHVPLSGVPPPEVMRASADLVSMTTHGDIVADTIGLGKTYLALLFINFTAMFHTRTQHKPYLVLAPNVVVLAQWLQAIN